MTAVLGIDWTEYNEMKIVFIILGVIAILNALSLYACIVVGVRSEREWNGGKDEMR